ncbi:MAG: phage integrase SAM-like domain-containing protein [Muribaculum sp.]|nr:phage integrase SAM-like domain-containing protein [Muribaculum sp.]
MSDSVKSAFVAKVYFEDLRKKVAEVKSGSTARYYIAMINRLEAYCGTDALTLEQITADFVSGFNQYLIAQGTTLSTVKLFMMAFRAVMKEPFGTERRDQLKEAFKAIGSKNEASAKGISRNDIKQIINVDLHSLPATDKIRDLFVYSTISCGMSQAEIASPATEAVIPQQRMISERFVAKYGNPLYMFAAKLTEEQYEQGLRQLSTVCGLKQILVPRDAADGWASAAISIGIEPQIITTILPADAAMSKAVTQRVDISDADKIKILRSVADSIIDMKARWYVMRCYGELTPAETIARIERDAHFEAYDSFKTYIAPAPIKKSKQDYRAAMLGNMVFFQCSAPNALKVRQIVSHNAYVYTFAGSRTPAYISNDEMRTFMLVCDINSDSISYYFADRQEAPADITAGQQALIVKGNLMGNVGIVNAVSKDRYKVVVSFQSLGAAKVTAEIPIEFLKFR